MRIPDKGVPEAGERRRQMLSSDEIEARERGTVPHAAQEKILLVEDDEAIRDTLGSMLEDEGYFVTTAENGRQALEALNSAPAPELIILDLRMPIMDGWEFRTLQKADPLLAGIPVLAISADGSAKAEAIDAAGYLHKPFSPEGVVDEVGRILVEAARQRLRGELDDSEHTAALASVGEEIRDPLAEAISNVERAEAQVIEFVDRTPGSGADLASVPMMLTECRQALNRIRDLIERFDR
jgi:CheY-like chemotaxis protein